MVDVPLVELCTLYLLACQVRVTVGDSGLCCCVCVTSFECQLTPLCVDFVKISLEYSFVCFASWQEFCHFSFCIHSWQKYSLSLSLSFFLTLHLNLCLYSAPFDTDQFLKAAEILCGTHNFLSFSTRNILKAGPKVIPHTQMSIRIERGSALMGEHRRGVPDVLDLWEVHFHGQSFLYRQVRTGE